MKTEIIIQILYQAVESLLVNTLNQHVCHQSNTGSHLQHKVHFQYLSKKNINIIVFRISLLIFEIFSIFSFRSIPATSVEITGWGKLRKIGGEDRNRNVLTSRSPNKLQMAVVPLIRQSDCKNETVLKITKYLKLMKREFLIYIKFKLSRNNV